MKPITIWVAVAGPNPWKVIIILEELGLPYDIKNIEFADLKKKPYTDINPNGRVPAIEDPNTDLVLWETGAIIQYLDAQYDTDKKLTYSSLLEKFQVEQWLFFQASGQGPYYGQAAWFINYHPEKIASAQERYVNEVKRIMTVLDTALEGKNWLVGDKCTYADLAFVSWDAMLPVSLGEYHATIDIKAMPNYHAWYERLRAMKSVEAALTLRVKMMEDLGIGKLGQKK